MRCSLEYRPVEPRLTVSPVCEKRFNRPSSLNTHMAVHTGAKRELRAELGGEVCKGPEG